MDGISTITQRGQVVIPQSIRKFFGLQPSDRLFFEVEEDKIIAKPLLSIEDAIGMIKTRKRVSKKEYKRTITRQVIRKIKRK